METAVFLRFINLYEVSGCYNLWRDGSIVNSCIVDWQVKEVLHIR